MNGYDTSPYTRDEEYIDAKGEFINPQGVATRDTIRKLDVEQLDNIIGGWPKITDYNPEKITDAVPKSKFNKTAQDLLRLLQMPTLSSGLNTVALDQSSTEDLFSKHKPADFMEEVRKTKFEVNNQAQNTLFSYLIGKFPYIIGYCRLIMSKEVTSDQDGLQRILGILTIYFYHGYNSASTSEFSFGTYATFRNWHSIAELLTSFYYVSCLQANFPEYNSYFQTLSPSEVKDMSDLILKLGSPRNLEKFLAQKARIPQIEAAILYSVDFACSGPKATIPVGAKITVRRRNKREDLLISDSLKDMVESQICGWIPKKNPTESLLLVGGTASGKTTVLRSTLVQVKRAAAELGMVFDTTSPLSNQLLTYHEQNFDEHKWDGATESGERTSIQISLRQAGEPKNVYYLVINDIAGEKFEEMLTIEKDYNVIQSPLSHAKHVIFLFDLVAWRQLGALLKTNAPEGWKVLVDERKRQGDIGRAVMDSRDLMMKLVERVVTATGSATLPVDRSFMLVIPKCDIYIKNGMFLNGWIKSLENSKYVEKQGDAEDAPYMATWNFKQDLGKGVDISDQFQTALNGINKMSVLATNAIKELSKKIPEDNTKVSAERIAVNIAEMLTYLEKTFRDVKVVPVSALGKAPDPVETQPTPGKVPANSGAADPYKAEAVPLFCEALLLLPMIKMRTELVEGAVSGRSS